MDWEPLWTGDAKEAPERVLSLRKLFRVNRKSGPHTPEGGREQQSKRELSSGYPYTKTHRPPPLSLTGCLTRTTLIPTGSGQFQSSPRAFLGTHPPAELTTLLCRAQGHLLAQPCPVFLFPLLLPTLSSASAGPVSKWHRLGIPERLTSGDLLTVYPHLTMPCRLRQFPWCLWPQGSQ